PTDTNTPTVTSSATWTPTVTASDTPGPSPTFTKTPTTTPTAVTPTPTQTPISGQIFDDVPASYWAYDYINALYNAGYVAGCSADPRLYCPDQILLRSESAVFVLRGSYGAIADPPYPAPSKATFKDVKSSFWGFGWIESLWKDGFTAGCGTDPLIYCPNQKHTRAEGSVFFLRVKNGIDYVPPDPTGLFDDVDTGAWYAPWVEAAYNQGLLPACNDDPLKFCPEDKLNRAWAAYMMVQAKGGLPLGSSRLDRGAMQSTTETASPTPTATFEPAAAATLSPTPTPTPTQSVIETPAS
ncbi:MAG: S-layer homology domain-containing protein, partial [Anaerolineales bacterium]